MNKENLEKAVKTAKQQAYVEAAKDALINLRGALLPGQGTARALIDNVITQFERLSDTQDATLQACTFKADRNDEHAASDIKEIEKLKMEVANLELKLQEKS